MILRKGDVVVASNGERSIEAHVMIASPNGRSLFLVWSDGMLGGYVGMMPVLQDESGQYTALMDGMPITLTRKDA